jgi:hypothetical protein
VYDVVDVLTRDDLARHAARCVEVGDDASPEYIALGVAERRRDLGFLNGRRRRDRRRVILPQLLGKLLPRRIGRIHILMRVGPAVDATDGLGHPSLVCAHTVSPADQSLGCSMCCRGRG